MARDATGAGTKGFRGRLDTPWAVLAIAALLYLAFLSARLAKHDGDASFFVTAGDLLVDQNAPKSLTVLKNNTGYDGEFYYRFALDPFTTQRTAFGITLDAPRYRHQRILYPLVTWALSLGHEEAVPWILILVNFAALCGIGWLGGTLARREGRHALWGLVFPLYTGFLLTLSRDLAEILEVGLVLGSLLCVRRGRSGWGGILLALAVLAKETALLAAGGAFLAWLSGRRRRPVEPGPLYFALPVAVFVLWQIVLGAIWGASPVQDIRNNIGIPFVSFGPFLGEAVGLTGGFRIKTSIELFLILLLAGSTISSLRGSRAPRHEKFAWVLYALLVFSLTRSVWCVDWSFFRAFSECHAFGAVILLSASPAARNRVFPAWLAGWIALALIVLKH